MAQLHSGAAAWYWESGDLDLAIRHATAADDVAAVSSYVWAALQGVSAVATRTGWPAGSVRLGSGA